MRRRPAAYALVVNLVLATFSAAQQVPLPPRDGQQPVAQGTAVIRGRVVQLDSGQGLRRVQIVARRDGADPVTAVTDDSGRYVLSALPAGSYRLAASRGGYVTIEHGQRRPLEPGRPIELANGQTLGNIDFSLPRGSVITGRVVDDAGEAMTGAVVQVHRYRYVNGQRQMAVAGGGAPTDDRGQFRVFGLLPGDYYVSAAPPGDTLAAMAALASGGGVGSILAPGTPSGYVRTYYPDTPWPASAQRVTVRLGEESAPITLQLVAGKTVSISGTVVSPDTAVTSSVMARPRGSDPMSFLNTGTMAVAQKGSFRLTGLFPGDYTLDAFTIDMTALPPKFTFGTIDVSVGTTDVTDVVITTGSGVTARGRIVFEGGDPGGVRPGQIQLSASSRIPSFAQSGGEAEDDWTFELTGLTGRRTIRATAPEPWVLKSITFRGRDITDEEVEFTADAEDVTVLFTRTGTDVSGRVTDARGTATSDYVVLIYADDRTRWLPGTRFIRTARPNQAGRYQIRGLPAGSYRAVALTYLEPGEELDPDRLEQLTSSSVRVDLRDGDTRTLDLRMSEL